MQVQRAPHASGGGVARARRAATPAGLRVLLLPRHCTSGACSARRAWSCMHALAVNALGTLKVRIHGVGMPHPERSSLDG